MGEQHRCAGSSDQQGHNFGIAFPWENTARVQQMFSDLNRFVQKTSKSLDILYDKRDDLAAVTLAMIENVPVFKELTDKENISLDVKSTRLFTLAALYDANAELLKGREKNDIETNAALLVNYWTTVAQHVRDWTKVFSRTIDLDDEPCFSAQEIDNIGTDGSLPNELGFL